jgi:sulfur carrier protein ThiS
VRTPSLPTDGARLRSVALGTVVLVFLLALAACTPPAAAAEAHRGRPTAAMRLEVPAGLALAPNGDLFIADQWLNEIVEHLPDGRFRVVAGTGRKGLSGDGGPATKAELDMPTALVRSPGGTLYFVDQGNRRVRAILANGKIMTVAGGGPLSADIVASGTPATEVSFYPSNLAIGPDGDLYVTDSDEVLELLPSGTFTEIAGPTSFADANGVSSCGPDAIAFDDAGLMWIGCDDSRLLEAQMPDGAFVVVASGYRPHDFPGIAAAPGGSMVVVDGESLSRFVGTTATDLLDLDDFSHSDTFVPSGVAVASNGTIYTDSQYGDGFTSGAALAEIEPDGKIVVLDSWKIKG